MADEATLVEKFKSLENRADIADMLEINEDRLIYHLYIIPAPKRYISFKIAKKSGNGFRVISAPVTALKIIQRKLNTILQLIYQPKSPVHGFVNNRNIVTNARKHNGRRYVFNVDLEDFYPSINFGRVRGLFMASPYNLNGEVATVLAQICCFDNQLPQGAPTSPIISNMICARLDSELWHLAQRCSCIYTRYADDITFSTSHRSFPKDLAVTEHIGSQVYVGDRLRRIIENNGFKINEAKVNLKTRSYHRQTVTGLTVNRFPNLPRQFTDQIRAMLHAWEKYGLDKAQQEYWTKYEKKPRGGFHRTERPLFHKVVRGKIDFLGQVRGKDNPKYLRYLAKYTDLMYGPIENALWVLEAIKDGDDGVEIIQGTAFMLMGHELITCAHVLCDGIQAYQPNNPSNKFDVNLLNQNSALDLARLQVNIERARQLTPLTKPVFESGLRRRYNRGA